MPARNSLTLFVLCALSAGAQEAYQKAPAAVQAVLDAPGQPQLSLALSGTRAMLVEYERHPGIQDLARPVARLAGERIDPNNRSPFAAPRIKTLTLVSLPEGKRQVVKLPKGLQVWQLRWAPDGRRFALLASSRSATELWIGEASQGSLRKVPELRVNASLGSALDWLPGSGGLLVTAVPTKVGAEPKVPETPVGPRIQEHSGKAAPSPTHQDLLQSPYDEQRFEFLAKSQLLKVDALSLVRTPLGKPGLIQSVQPAPDGKHLLVSLLHRPFSYQVGHGQFPLRHEIWSLQGQLLRSVADLPLAAGIPFDGVRPGPRHLHWVPGTVPSLAWIEALDGGDPKAKVPHRDRLMQLSAPFTQEARELLRTEHRLAGVQWAEQGDFLVLREFQREKRWLRTWMAEPGKAPFLLWERNANDRYGDPGQFLTRTLPTGLRVLQQEGRDLILSGPGGTPDGDRPFLDRYHLDTRKSERVFRCAEKEFEQPLALLPEGRILTRHENPTTPPSYRLRKGETLQTLTEPVDPAPAFARVEKRLVKYARPDGVELSFTMYLPPEHREGQRHPGLVWAYPMEFTDAATAGQVSGSPHRFVRPGGISQLLLALSGYVVLDNATMPVVGDPETVNNTFIEQVVASAKAAIDKAAELGVLDPQRVAVGGHSYGAFMTANLLAHSTLFKAGIARSGAYNRTLTPFGFQSERRTLWEAPDMYLKVSPFLQAHQFKAPILLIHGEADNNSGTFPIQSERLFQALKGNGKTVRYLTLPHESHGYIARESVAHVQWEMLRWLDSYLKP